MMLMRWIGDLVLAMNQEASDGNPDSEQHTAQLHLCSVACWDTETMAKTSRKLFNSTKDVAWARRAAWAEWAKVSLWNVILPQRGQTDESVECTSTYAYSTDPRCRTHRIIKGSLALAFHHLP